MRKICDLNNGAALTCFGCKKARNHGDCGGSVKVFYLPLNSVNFFFDRMTRNQLNRKVPWVRIPPAPPFKACKPRVCRLFSVLFTLHSIPHGVFRQLFPFSLNRYGDEHMI